MVIGRFYFKQTFNGNLLGEFSNTQMNQNRTESADRITEFSHEFIGSYKSTWFEKSAQLLNLEIQFKIDSNDSLFSLTWRNNLSVVFRGEGFIVDDILIGDYRDEEVELFIKNQF